MTPADIPRLLSDPSPQDWRKVARILDKMHDTASHDLPLAVKLVKRCIASWPADARKCVPREPLDHWRRASADNPHGHDDLLDLCLKIRHESATYGYYETYVCNDPALLWTTDGPWGRTGCQQVHLVRGFSGPARSVRSDAWLRIGEAGQGDLVGWLSVSARRSGCASSAELAALLLALPPRHYNPEQPLPEIRLARR